MAETIEHFQPAVDELYGGLALQQARSDIAARASRWLQAGVPADIAERVAALDTLFAALDIAEVAGEARRPIVEVAGVYFDLGARLGLAWLRERIGALPADSHWQVLAKGALRDDVAGLARTLTAKVIASGQAGEPAALVAAWQARKGDAMERATRLAAELRAAPALDIAMLSVAVRELRNLA